MEMLEIRLGASGCSSWRVLVPEEQRTCVFYDVNVGLSEFYFAFRFLFCIMGPRKYLL